MEFGVASPSNFAADEAPSPGQEVASQARREHLDTAEQPVDATENRGRSSTERLMPSLQESTQPAGTSLKNAEQAAPPESPAQAEVQMSEQAVEMQPRFSEGPSSDPVPQRKKSSVSHASESAEPDDKLSPLILDPTGNKSEAPKQSDASPMRLSRPGTGPPNVEEASLSDEQDPLALSQQQMVVSDQEEEALPALGADAVIAETPSLLAAEELMQSEELEQIETSLPSARKPSSATPATSEGRSEVAASKSKASLASKDRKTMPVSESARALGPNLVTSHRSLIPPKPAAQTLHAAGKKAPEVRQILIAHSLMIQNFSMPLPILN